MHLQICRVDMHKTLCLFVFFPRRQIQITLHLFNLSSCASRRLAFVVWSDLKIIGWIILQFYRCSFPLWGGKFITSVFLSTIIRSQFYYLQKQWHS